MKLTKKAKQFVINFEKKTKQFVINMTNIARKVKH